jgi:3-oxoacyl-[acyl-carrier protein] reductase
MRKRGGGRMVMTGSGMGHSSLHGHAAYSCSKSALWMLVRILADELRVDGISVNELVPGPVQTAMTGVPQRTGSVVNNPVEWLKQPEDVVPLAMFLATHPGPGPTGQSFSLMRRTF